MEEWLNPDAKLTEAAAERRVLTCVDCHNRVGHRIPTPEELVDAALADGRLDASLPYLKREALRLLAADGAATDADMLHAAWSQEGWFDQLEEFYAREYPGVYAAKRGSIERAVNELRGLSSELLHPAMRTSWLTYPDNLRHPQADGGAPGCFRCHGTLVSPATGERLAGACSGSGCLSCHSFDEPQARAGQPQAEADRTACALCHISVPADQIASLLPEPASGTGDALSRLD